ncbi:uncharacterized protein KGF55_002887 [Candida pseudojiufengensis]|uniref:uncharacterized protein n=1 Tax=Candida pseudojiufengensis TaxID=497109 RepID=UPI0022252255|nr:uncharacterized protein KGF55_002887 [Candida pseudojiufengensis]KAI5963095.1 hypothetical protein KGF55_002887 [Candida pseudojiufengensis]
MVLYKRKQVPFIPPPPTPTDLTQEVWVIPNTKEWFLTYEEFLTRLDFYNKRKFVCEITGNSCLTYFEALTSELNEKKELDKNFPENLREHILRYLQFNRISRLDQLVDKVYQIFKNDYFPGEMVFLKGLDPNNLSTKSRGVIREKVQYGADKSTKYLVIRSHDKQQAIVTGNNISRDRNHFTKWLIKTFIKLTMSRSHKVGAPWVVKSQYAKQYNIPSTYPEDLKQYIDSTPNGEPTYVIPKKRKLDFKEKDQSEEPSTKQKSSKEPLEKKRKITIKEETKKNSTPISNEPIIPFRKKFPNHHLPQRLIAEIEEEEAKGNSASSIAFQQPTKKTIVEDLDIRFDIQKGKPSPKILKIKSKIKNELIPLQSISEALQVWVFMNVYHNVLNIDTFTFDDFISALNYNSIEIESSMIDEIFCSLLCKFISNEIPSSKDAKLAKENDSIYGLNIALPERVEDDDDEDDDDEEEEEKDQEKKEDHKVKKEKDENINDKEEDDRGSDSDTEHKPLKIDDDEEESKQLKKDDSSDNEPKSSVFDHSAYEYLNFKDIPWHDRLRRRNLKDGNWQIVLIGILSLIESVPKYFHLINEIFKKLAPKNMSVNLINLQNNFEDLDINLKLKILSILTELLINSPLVRNYIEESLDQQTVLRRTRLDNIKEYRSDLEIALNAQKFIDEHIPKDEEESIEEDKDKDKDKSQPQPVNNKLGIDLKIIEPTEKELEASAKNPELKKQLAIRKEAVLKIIEFKKNKKLIEQKLNELDCQRVKLLGKDRLYNRYWWFENNGLPTLHSGSNEDEDDEEDDDKDNKQNKSTDDVQEGNDQHDEEDEEDDDDDDVLDETYLMGRLWVQGPTDTDMITNFKIEIEEIRKLINEIPDEFEDEGLEELVEDSQVQVQIQTQQQARVSQPPQSPPVDSNEPKKEANESTTLAPTPTPTPVPTTRKKPIEMNFTNIPESYKAKLLEYNIKLTNNEILLNKENEVLINNEGTLQLPLQKLNNIQRKFIEELTSPLLNSSSWKYYDEIQDINKLISWLNPWGKRESSLRKELISVKDVMFSSIKARHKAMNLKNFKTSEEIEINENIIALRKRILQLQLIENNNGNNDQMQIDSIDDTNMNNESVEEIENDDLETRTRSRRSKSQSQPKKKQISIKELLVTGSINQCKEKIQILKQDIIKLNSNNEINRILEWVNSSALEKFGKSLYEGGDKNYQQKKSVACVSKK